MIDYKIKILLFIVFLSLVFNYIFYERNKNIFEHFQMEEIKKFKDKIENINNKYKKKNKKKKKSSEIKLFETSKIKEEPELTNEKLYYKKILITGATSGIGYHIAKMLNKYNPFLIVTGKDEKKVKSLVEELSKTNESVKGIHVDLSKKQGPKKLYDYVRSHHSKLDILINAASTNIGSRFLLSKSYNDWQDEMSVNVNSSILLSQMFSKRMKGYGIKGKIINISSGASKMANSDVNSGSDIVMKNMIEKYSNILAEELYEYKISVTVVRIEHDIDYGYINILNKKVKNTPYKNLIKGFLGDSPSKILPVFLYTVKAPFHEISGKVISTKAFLENEKLSKIIPPQQLNINNEVYKNVVFTKEIDRKDKTKTYLVKQNPYDASPRVKKMLTKKYSINKFNTVSKYTPIIDSIISKKLNTNKENIVFFKTEYDAMKKICDIFVPKYQEIIIQWPEYNILKLVTVENKIKIKYAMYKKYRKKFLLPDLQHILDTIGTKTKMIYLSSPNLASGQSIVDNAEFKDFINKVPKNIFILIDQRYIEFTTANPNKILNGINYLDRDNVGVLRTFNNYYSIENLELTYLITNSDFAKIIKDTQLINPIDKFTEDLALAVYQDKYYENIKYKIKEERKRMFKLLDDNKIPYYTSEVNYFLIDTEEDSEIIKDQLEKNNIILYISDEEYGTHWVLPLGTKKTNDTVFDTIIYSQMK